MYISNIMTQTCVYSLKNMDKQRAFWGISNMIYDGPSKMVPEQLFGSYDFFFLQSFLTGQLHSWYIVSVLGQEEGYTVKYTPPPEGVPDGEARGNS